MSITELILIYGYIGVGIIIASIYRLVFNINYDKGIWSYILHVVEFVIAAILWPFALYKILNTTKED
jgi:hypothetical protein